MTDRRTADRSAFALLLLGLALSGCAVVPGIRMDTEAEGDRWWSEVGDGADLSPMVRPIDATLLLEQRRARDAVAAQALLATAGDARPDDYQYRVGPGDVINIVVWGHPELSNPMGQTQNIEGQARLVREDGTLFFPFIGVLDVSGQTVEQIRERVARGLDRFVTDPQVDVRVVSFRSQKVYVTGEVRQPGILPVTDRPLTVLDAINQAGGFNEMADRRLAVLTRGERETAIDILQLYATGRGNMLLQDRDVLFIPDNEPNKVFLMGEVAQQVAVPLHDGRLTLAEAITGAGGFDLSVADTRNVYVLRGGEAFETPDGARAIRPEVYHLDARSGTALLLAEGFQLEPRDIIYVSSTGVVRFNRVIQQILPTIQTIWQTDRIIND